MNNTFIQSFAWNIEYSILSGKGCKIITSKEVNNKIYDTYFLAWKKTNITSRAKDKDIDIVNYIRIDIDLRKQVKKLYWYNLLKDGFKEMQIKLISLLNNNKWFKDWRWFIFSWNWFHIYYIWDKISISPYIWQNAMKRIYRQFNETICKWNEHFYADYATCNLARIMRMPWTINQKNWEMCKIINYNKNAYSVLLEKAYILWQAEINQHKNKIVCNKNNIQSLGFSKTENSFYDDINNNIKASDLSQKLYPQFKLSKNWRNFYSDKNNGNTYTGFYYIKDKNIIINWWSSYYNWWDINSWYNNFQIIKKSQNFNNKETFDFFTNLLIIKQWA